MSENNQPINGEYKFNNCKHRSQEQRTTIIRRCPCQGGDYEDTGFDCNLRQIFKVDPDVCEYCHSFEKK